MLCRFLQFVSKSSTFDLQQSSVLIVFTLICFQFLMLIVLASCCDDVNEINVESLLYATQAEAP